MFTIADLMEKLFAVFLLITVVLLLVAGVQSPSFNLVVHSSSGGSFLVGEDVLLPGEPIRTGDRVRSRTHSLELVTNGRELRFRLQPGSDVSFHRVLPDTPRMRVLIHSGSGQVDVRTGRVDIILGGSGYSVSRGSLRWMVGEENVNVHRTEETGLDRMIPYGYFSDERNVNVKFVSSLPSETIPEESLKTEWYTGSMEPGRRVVSAIEKYYDRVGAPPESLRSVFGYWVRDEYGQVYLYEQTGSGFRLVSAGMDRAMFTQDDQRWAGEFDRSE